MTIQEMIQDSFKRTTVAIEKRKTFILDTTGATSASSMCAWYNPSKNRVKITPFNYVPPADGYLPIIYVGKHLRVFEPGAMPSWVGGAFYFSNFHSRIASAVDHYWMNYVVSSV